MRNEGTAVARKRAVKAVKKASPEETEKEPVIAAAQPANGNGKKKLMPTTLVDLAAEAAVKPEPAASENKELVLSDDMPEVPDVEAAMAKNKAVVNDLPKLREKTAGYLKAIADFEKASRDVKLGLQASIALCSKALCHLLFGHPSVDVRNAAWMELYRFRFSATFDGLLEIFYFLTEMAKKGELVFLKKISLAEVTKKGEPVSTEKTGLPDGVVHIFVERHFLDKALIREGWAHFSAPEKACLNEEDIKEVRKWFREMIDRTMKNARRNWGLKADELRKKYSSALTLTQLADGQPGYSLLEVPTRFVPGRQPGKSEAIEGGLLVVLNRLVKNNRNSYETRTFIVDAVNDADEKCVGKFASKVRAAKLVLPEPYVLPDIARGFAAKGGKRFPGCPKIHPRNGASDDELKRLDDLNEARHVLALSLQRAWDAQQSQQNIKVDSAVAAT